MTIVCIKIEVNQVHGYLSHPSVDDLPDWVKYSCWARKNAIKIKIYGIIRLLFAYWLLLQFFKADVIKFFKRNY